MPRRATEGYVLLPVLILSGILAFLATAILVNTRSLAIGTADFRERISARAVTDAAINRVIIAYAFADDPAGAPDPLKDLLKPNGRTVAWVFAGTTVHLSVQAESGKLDLNAAPLELVEALVNAEVSSPLRRERILARIREFRRNRMIIPSVAVILDPIDRMTETLAGFEALLTVHTYQSGVDGASAPETVLMALPDLSAEQRRQLLDGRDEMDGDAFDLSRHLIPPKPVYTIQASVRTRGGTTLGRRAIVELSTSRPPRIYAWRDASPRFGERVVWFSDTSRPTPD